MTLKDVSLDDKFDLEKNQVLLSGVQALVRLTMMQKMRDKDAGLDTAGYVTGYRGSPLGGVDQQFWKSRQILKKYDVKFEPGLNEDLAATALWGSQQSELRGEGRYDGVFGIWYGKGPGVDRTGDVFRHANAAGSSKNGGVLALLGDDHTAESSTVPHQSEFAMMDAMIPVLHPAGVQEILDYGQLGIAMSRFSGCWVGLKCVHDNIESTAIVDSRLDRIDIKIPKNFEMPEGGLNIWAWDDRHEQEIRLHTHKRFAAVAFARANNIDKIILNGGPKPKIGIVTTGKSYLDVRQALDQLGIDEVDAAKLGIRLLKIGMVWPLDPEIVEEFSKGLDYIMVVEEKRSLLETQIREQLYGRKTSPVIIGKKDEVDNTLFQAHGSLSPNQIAVALGGRLIKIKANKAIEEKVTELKNVQRQVGNNPDITTRIPYFCAGCPHNSSTIIPEGGRGYAGIGCHWMAQYVPDRKTEGATHMGGEGANWIGEAPFSTRNHVFQNLGDGTYNHSGILALRAAVASDVNMTYKILYNDAVAMTGGQTHEGGLSVSAIAQQVAAEGVKRLVIVSDQPEKFSSMPGLPPYTTIHHRSELNAVQKELMEIEGVTALIYEQTCAAEKRRRRKRGLFPDPARRVFINDLVCEGCGDCGIKSNCVAVAPLETEFGRKRKIDQSACNKDFSCLNGFCPSFVTIEGGQLRKGKGGLATDMPDVFEVLPDPDVPSLASSWSALITGIGGTGVVTVGQILGMAAHMEGLGVGIIDMAGLSQKNGAVVTHIKIAGSPDDIPTIRVAEGGADVMIGCDLVTTAAEHNLNAASKARTRAIVNAQETMPAQFTHLPDFDLAGDSLKVAIQARVMKDGATFIDATRIASALLGDTIAANLFTLGAAYQSGLVPVTAEGINKAIELNGIAIEMNQLAFLWGRRAIHNLAAVEKIIAPVRKTDVEFAQTIDEMIEVRRRFLTAYQNAAYGDRYVAVVQKVRDREAEIMSGDTRLSEAVAKALFKLMAIKDEYEVARLYTDGTFAQNVAKNFEGDFKLNYHLAPPIFSRRNPDTGHLVKQVFGPWMGKALRFVAAFKGLRGTAFDPFGYTQERRLERELLRDYETLVEKILGKLDRNRYSSAVALAGLPQTVRGYGHVKHVAIEAYRQENERLSDQFETGKPAVPRAAE